MDDGDERNAVPERLEYARTAAFNGRGRRRPMPLSDRIAVCVVLGAAGVAIVWCGIVALGQGRSMNPGYGEHGRLIRVGLTLMAIGGLVVYLGVRTLGRGRDR